MRDDSSVERFLGNDNDKIGFHFGVTVCGTYRYAVKFSKISYKIPNFLQIFSIFNKILRQNFISAFNFWNEFQDLTPENFSSAYIKLKTTLSQQ